MTSLRCLPGLVFFAVWGWAAHAAAQAPAQAPVEALAARPSRESRPFFIGGELGWNGLSGLGAHFAYHVVPRLALDAGLGLSLTGLRAGAGARFNFLTSSWTPFVGGGFSYALGSGAKPVETTLKGDTVKFQVLRSPFLDLTTGVNYTGADGFAFTATTGYAILLRDHNTHYVEGSRQAFDDVRGIYKGGLVLALAVGYAF